jgi:hypothetical protein
MAKVDLDLKVSVESCLHYAFQEIAKEILTKHSIVIESVSFEWLDVIGQNGYILKEVRMQTRTQ